MNQKSKTQYLKRKIIEYNSKLVKNSSRPDIIKSNILKLERLILNKKFIPDIETEIIKSEEIRNILPTLQHFYEVFETNLESEFVNSFLNGRTAFSRYMLYKRFVMLVKNEINLTKISKTDHILFIGSGPLPITAILLSKFVGCPIDCYDKNKEFVRLSRKVVSKLRLQKGIGIYHKKGENLIKKHYSIVIVALLAKPKDKILKRVWVKISPNARVICRTSDGVRQVFYEQTDPNILRLYNPVKKVYAKGNQTISSVLLVKK